ncbi:MAG TPA: zinc-ribbon domain-containing protein [Ktedonobacterales bacterium]|jgi:hypothetical protein
MTCTHCGADAVDASGVCQACGWHAQSVPAPAPGEADALAETREADIPLPARRATTARNAPTPSAPTPFAIAGTTPAPRSGPRTGAYGGGAPATTRYCGTCGAEIEEGRQFCGQCGTPVAPYDETDSPRTIAAPRRGTFPPAGYADDDDEMWSPADQDAPTEQFIPPYSRPNAPYRQSGYYGAAAPTGGGMSRETRVLLGILCILGALVSGAGAIVVALLH